MSLLVTILSPIEALPGTFKQTKDCEIGILDEITLLIVPSSSAKVNLTFVYLPPCVAFTAGPILLFAQYVNHCFRRIREARDGLFLCYKKAHPNIPLNCNDGYSDANYFVCRQIRFPWTSVFGLFTSKGLYCVLNSLFFSVSVWEIVRSEIDALAESRFAETGTKHTIANLDGYIRLRVGVLLL
ncbi:hypothetical protein BJ742DRAFT_64836 [Cladochytrium replicatum]|nr:hypothetical protein BJ742DRAFT_64836 [Cladochytrium replicatum]